MRLRHLPSLCLTLAALVVGARAQSIRWDPPSGSLAYNQVSELALVFEDCEPDGLPKLPSVDGISYGNNPGRSSQTSIVNFKMSQTYSLIYPVRVTKRVPVRIPSFEIETNRGRVRVPAASYTVGDATLGNAGSGPALDDIAAARLNVPSQTVWAGEVFPLTYTLSVVKRYFHSLASLLSWQPAPLVAEDWSKPEPAEALVRGERQVVSTQNSRGYLKEPGNFTLPGATQAVNLVVGTTGFSLLSQAIVEPRQLETQPLALTVKPLPPAPSEFGGAVGQFTFVSKVVPTTAAVGEPITWTIELAGTGNWPDISGLPSREVSQDFQVVQPKSKRVMKDGALFEGTLSEDVVLVPTRPGKYTLGPVRFTYFDPKAGAYRTITTDQVTVSVGAAPAPAAASSGQPTFSLPDVNAPAATVAHPPAVPPVTPGNLPRDPLPAAGSAAAPLSLRALITACAALCALLPLAGWLVLATLRARARDPQRRRREARARLAAILATLRAAPDQAARRAALQAWCTEAAALWEVPHAAPGAPLLQAHVAAISRDAAAAWSQLWLDADRDLHGPGPGLPDDWAMRAEGALRAVKVPSWPFSSVFAAANLLPFLGRRAAAAVVAAAALVAALSGAPAQAQGAKSPADAYRGGDFAAAEQGWRAADAAAPRDWAVHHNLGLALAQQDRWPEATAHWVSAFLANPGAEATRWDLALGLQQSGMAPPELVAFSRGEGRHALARVLSPAGWQRVLLGSSLLLALAVILALLQAYGWINGWARATALSACLVAILVASLASFSLRTYGVLADPGVGLVWKASVLRSIPTEADTTQKTSPLSAGSLAVVDKTFLGWSRLSFPGGQTGWVRSDDLRVLYR